MKELWIINQYIQTPSNGSLTRHYTFAPHLAQHGYHATLITGSAIHNSDINMIKGSEIFREVQDNGRDFVYVRTASYQGNGLSRIKSMFDYYINVQRVADALVKRGKRPDIIYASSPQPLACAAALKIAKKLNVPCVCEVRDLWPESIVQYQHVSPKNPAIVFLRGIEKRIYSKCDALIFTMTGAYDYVKSHGWSKLVDEKKVFYINNGIELDKFDENARTYVQKDELLDDDKQFCVVYCGSIRRANNLISLIKTVQLAKAHGLSNLNLIIYGKGNQEADLKAYCTEHGMDYVYFRGFVTKEFIPSITTRADINTVCVMKTPLYELTGISSNKTFEYLSAGKPILSNAYSKENTISDAGCGIVCETDSPQVMAEALEKLYSLTPEELDKQREGARTMAKRYDYSVLSEKLVSALEYAQESYNKQKKEITQ